MTLTCLCAVHGAEWCGCHGYLCSVPQAELCAEAGLPAVGRRPLHLPHREAQVTLVKPAALCCFVFCTLYSSHTVQLCIQLSCTVTVLPLISQVTPSVQEGCLCGSHGDVCGGCPLQQQTDEFYCLSFGVVLVCSYSVRLCLLVAGGNGSAGLPVAPPGEEGGGGHERAEGAQ